MASPLDGMSRPERGTAIGAALTALAGIAVVITGPAAATRVLGALMALEALILAWQVT
jgi:hypothetical protein